MTFGTDGTTSRSHLLTTYLSPPGLMAFTTHRHDQCAALWRLDDNRITLVRYWELERMTGYKHHQLPLYDPESGPGALIDRLLAEEGVSQSDLIGVWGTPGLGAPNPVGSEEIAPGLDRCGLPIHSLAHLFSGLCMDWDRYVGDTVVALAIDGGPDYTLESDPVGDHWYAGAVSIRGDVVLVPVESPGALWQAAQRRFTKEPGTLMALAGVAPGISSLSVAPLLEHRYWGGFPLMEWCYEMIGKLIKSAEEAVDAAPDAADTPDGNGGSHGKRAAGEQFSREELVTSVVMQAVQQASTVIAERNVRALLDRFGIQPEEAYLSMSGGFALNCPTNSTLIDRFGFRGLLAPPCANDSGQALGLGLLGFFARGWLASRRVELGLPYVGRPVRAVTPAAEPDSPVEMTAHRDRVREVRSFDPEQFAADVIHRPVAWVDGAAEIGPRALGHRSLLGDPRSPATKRFLNTVKQRQWWRPVAPIVLEEFAAEWFTGARRSPYMLETFPVAPHRLTEIPAVAHLDGSARIQTLIAADEPALTQAVQAFHRATGVPVLCNTSLNDRGEPIADTPDDAVAFCLRKGIDVIYIEGRRHLLDLTGPPPDGPQPRPLADLYADQEPRPDALYGPDADPELLFLLSFWPALHSLLDSESGTPRLAAVRRHVAARNHDFAPNAEQFVEFWKDLLEGRVWNHGGLRAR